MTLLEHLRRLFAPRVRFTLPWLRSAVERFEQAAGLEPGTIVSEAANYRSHRDLMARFELARALDGFSPEHLAGTLAKAADSLRALEELKRGAT